MAGRNKDAARALKKAGESSKKTDDSISPALPKKAVPVKDRSRKGPKGKSKEGPSKTPNKSDDSESDEPEEDPSWMFYDTEDSSYHGSSDEKSDEELHVEMFKTDGEGSDGNEPKAKRAKTGGEASSNDEPEKKKQKKDVEASGSSKGNEV